MTELPSFITPDLKLALEKAWLPLNQDGMLLLWQKTKAELDVFKSLEMDYRKVCAAFLVPSKTEGTNTVELGNGYQAKIGIKFNYKLGENKTVEAGLDKISALGNEGSFVAERLISWTPNFLLTEYRKLQEEAQNGSQFAKDALKITNEFLIIDDAAPTLDIKEPKKKK